MKSRKKKQNQNIYCVLILLFCEVSNKVRPMLKKYFDERYSSRRK